MTTQNDNSIASRTLTQLRNKIPIGYNGMLHIHPQNGLFSWGDLHSRLLASSLDPADLPPQTAPRSNQSFSTIHRTDRHTHTDAYKPTDGIGDITCTNTAYALLTITTRLIFTFYSPKTG